MFLLDCFVGDLVFSSVTMARMNRPAPVEITYKNMRFLITHNPTNATLNKFIEVSPHIINTVTISEINFVIKRNECSGFS